MTPNTTPSPYLPPLEGANFLVGGSLGGCRLGLGSDKRCLHNVSRIIAGNAVAFGRKSCDVSSQGFVIVPSKRKAKRRGKKENFESDANKKKVSIKFLSPPILGQLPRKWRMEPSRQPANLENAVQLFGLNVCLHFKNGHFL